MLTCIVCGVTCKCEPDKDVLIADAVAEISTQAISAASNAMTAAMGQSDERLALLESRIADLESAIASIVADGVTVEEMV